MKWILSLFCLTACLAAVTCTLCRTEADCRDGYCCLVLKERFLARKGICLPLRKEGRRCSEADSKSDSDGGKYVKYCPCRESLVCEPKGLREGVTDPGKIKASLRCQKPTATNPPEIVTDKEVVETEKPEEEIVETEAPEEEIIETEAPEEEVVETEAPEEEIVDEVVETEAPEEEIVDKVVETEAPEEEIVETEAPEEEIVDEVIETEAPEEEIVDEVGDEILEPEEGPGGGRPRDDDCEDWELPCHEPERGPGGEPPRDDDCEDWELPC